MAFLFVSKNKKKIEKQPTLSWGTFGICIFGPLFLPVLVCSFFGVEGEIVREGDNCGHPHLGCTSLSLTWSSGQTDHPLFPMKKKPGDGSWLLDFSSQGLAWNPSRKVIIASPPPWFRVKELPPTSCNLSSIESNAILRMYQKPTHWQVMLQLPSAFFRPMYYVFPCCRDSRKSYWWCPHSRRLYSS